MPDPEELHTAFFLFWSGNICHRLKNTRLAIENPTGTYLPMIHCILKVMFNLSECFRLLELSTRYFEIDLGFGQLNDSVSQLCD